MDLNSSSPEDSLFIMGIQTKWPMKMMTWFEDKHALSIDATYGTS